MRINNNITALNSHRQYGINNKNISKNMEKLSSGFRVNRAADDAAGLAISEKMRSQIRGLNMASKNSQDAVSLVQTAEGGMQTIQDILQRMRELAVQSASDTNQNTVDRQALQLEVNQLIEEIDQISKTTEFNKMQLLNGTGVFGDSTGNGGVIQAGANYDQTMTIMIGDMTSGGLGVDILTNTNNVALTNPVSAGSLADDTLGIANQASAAEAISTIDVALNKVSMARAKLGAYQNRLEYKIQNLDNQAENVSAAESRIRDADMAKMMTEFTKNSILFQASTAMLAQANALPQGVLQLLG
ncbi:MAG: flagellin [Oscillospiraceae bacterium]|nr:flagellin [Oscillospiraceae bacterium]